MFTPTNRRAAYTISSPLSSYILFLHHVLSILHICFAGARLGQRAYAQGLDMMIIVRVVGPPIGRTSPPTNWLDCSALTPAWRSLRRRPVGSTAHRMGFIVSYAGDSSVFGFFVQASLAKLRTPLVVGSCYVSSVCYQTVTCCSDQGADLGQHVWGLDMRMLDDVGKLVDFFSLTLLQDSFFIFHQARGLSGYASPDGECSAYFLIYHPH